MTFIELIKDLIGLERRKHQRRVEDLRRVEPYRFPVFGTQIRKE
jgi:hypothetical protein